MNTADAPFEVAPGVDATIDPMVSAAAPADAEEAIVLTETEQRLRKATHLVYSASLWSAASGIVPVPFLDMAAIGVVQIKLIRDLSKLYGQSVTKEAARKVLSVALGVLLPTQVASLAGSAAKAIPMLGTVVGAVSMAGVAGAATYAIGKVFIEHLESGGTIGTFSVDHTRDALKREFRAARETRPFGAKKIEAAA